MGKVFRVFDTERRKGRAASELQPGDDEEGIFVGGSGGTAMAGALKYADRMKDQDVMVILLPDTGERYLSKIYNDDWMRENGFLEDQPGLGTVRDLLQGKAGSIVSASPTDKVRDVVATLKSLGISQLPVLDEGKLKGIVAEVDLLRHLVTGAGTLDSSIAGLIESDYATVTPETKIELVQQVLSDAKMAIVTENEGVVGIACHHYQ